MRLLPLYGATTQRSHAWLWRRMSLRCVALCSPPRGGKRSTSLASTLTRRKKYRSNRDHESCLTFIQSQVEKLEEKRGYWFKIEAICRT
mmetsp:Transcript_24707/g.72303  ORF Transcript_24707/g.72303 Transcript_24707/m.72303 type:complete len:89 (+) Transcript_24707:984-1250(+)